MGSLTFYPRLTDEMVERAAPSSTPVALSYYGVDGQLIKLDDYPLGHSSYVGDERDNWKPQLDGLNMELAITIAYPLYLKGPEGVIPSCADYGICLLWSSKKMSLSGCMVPSKRSDEEQGTVFEFRKEFEPGELAGDISISVQLYLKDASRKENLFLGEEMLANERGMMLGELFGKTEFKFEDDSAEFPIAEFSDPEGPLWKIEFGLWTDPRVDRFSEENIRLLLNRAWEECPRSTDKGYENMVLLAEIMAQAYYLTFEKVKVFDGEIWNELMCGSEGFESGSICKVLHWFASAASDSFCWNTPEGMMISIKRRVDQAVKMVVSNER